MERKNILTSQKEIVLSSWKDKFSNSGVDVVKYLGEISAETYCAFIGLDYSTVRRLGNVTYNISYLKEVKEEEELFLLLCETYIDSVMNDKLSFILEDSEDYLGFFTKEEEQKIGVAQWLPSNWKELITDEQLHDILQERNIQTIECLQDNDVPDEMKERIVKDWCEENSSDLQVVLSDSVKADIAYDYIDDNASDCVDRAYSNLGDYEKRGFIKDCIDEL